MTCTGLERRAAMSRSRNAPRMSSWSVNAMTCRPTRSATSRIASGDDSPSPRSECSWRSARPTPEVLKHGPLLRGAADVPLEHPREPLHALAHVRLAVAGARDLQRRLERCREYPV